MSLDRTPYDNDYDNDLFCYFIYMILPILTVPNPVLTTSAEPVREITDDIRKLAADMRETMHNAHGIGLAAPQVGRSIALCMVELHDEEEGEIIPYTALVNPRITWTGFRKQSDEEGCLSIPGLYGNVSRPIRVRIKAKDLDGKTIQIEASGLMARALQHEIDHLNGVLFTQFVPKTKLREREVPDYPRI